ncbi:MAG TPA: hypothetical protein DHU96_07270 [Actinobacteria bacterium]|nr:hypothetical protein [Actinomycetota bacterium]
MPAIAVAPPHGLAVVFARVAAEIVVRADRPHGHERPHDRILHVAGDSQERAYPVTSVTGGMPPV